MLDYTRIENRLKSFLKNNRRLGYSVALLVSFLINGGFSYADGITVVPQRSEISNRIVQEQGNISQMLKDADKNISDIELKIKKLTQRGEFWVKPLERSTQVFFLTSVGNYTRNRNRTEQNFTEPEYGRSSTVSGSSKNVYAVNSNGISVLAGEEAEATTIYNGKNYGEYGIIKEPLEFVDRVDFGANISPKTVAEKTITEKTVEVKTVTSPTVSAPTINVSQVSISTPEPIGITPPVTPGTPSVNVPTLNTIPAVSNVQVNAIASLNVTPNIPTVAAAPTVTAPTVTTPVAPAGFNPKLITPPEKPAAPEVESPNIFTPPEIRFLGRGFGQGADVVMLRNNIIIQNYDSYDTVDRNNNATKGILNIEVGNLGGSVKSKWWGTNLDGSANSNIQMQAITNVPHTETPGITQGGRSAGAGTFYLGDGQSNSPLNAFINELRDHDATISGNYILTNKGGEGDINRNVIFLSHNPAGVGGGTADGVPGGPYDGQAQPLPKTATFNGSLTLHGTATPFTGATASSDVTIGVEHQLWSFRVSGDWITVGAYSIFDNRGTITLASGNNLVGILIDVEYWNNDDGPAHKTINSNLIEIKNAQNSIAIDYGQYLDRTFKSDLTVGNIIVGGKKNYGLRMTDVFPGNANYFDKGTTIQSGGDNKRILVQGEENVGVSIAKFLSSTADTNPIANISGLNITVDGKDGVGFLRNAGYSNNNTNDMILNSTTMGSFLFGENAQGSTLIRSDKYGITIAKNITVDKGKKGNSFAQAINAGTITNTATLKNTNGIGFTGLIAQRKLGTDKPLVTNSGTIEITGDGTDNNGNIGIAALTDSKVVNTGTISVTGKGKKKVGVYNAGEKVELKEKTTINIEGELSSGIYNTSVMEISSATTDKVQISAKNGATAIYSHGGSITSTADDKLEITVDNSATGAPKKGLAVYADNAANVNLTKAKITVKDGEAGVAAYDASTNLNLTNSTIDYGGSGYAVYSDGNGKINLTNSNIALRGSSTLMDVDMNLTPATRPITTSNTVVKVFSNDVVALNLTNLGSKDVTYLPTIASSLGLNISAGTEGSTTFDKYKEFAIDDATITFNTAVNRADDTNTAGGYFFKRVLGQRLKLNVNENVTARLTTQQADDFYSGQVVGIEANSSKKATSNIETKVTVAANKTIDAARTDRTDKGATGIFINYGQVENNGTISVEQDTTANSEAVGIYAVNSSEVVNKKEIKVGGNKSVGVLGMAYRTKADNSIVGAEFGATASNQGRIYIQNNSNSNITMSGENAIGIYANNNNTSSAVTHHTVENKGTITVGKSSGSNTAVAIYANKVQVFPEDGTLKISEGAVGIYAEPATVIGSSTDNLGTIHYMGKKGVGIYLNGSSDGDSVLNGTKLTLKDEASTNYTDKIGILYGDSLQNAQSSVTEIDASAAKNVIAYYTQKKNLTVDAPITLSEASTGISAKTGENIDLTYGNDTTAKILNVGKKSTGVFGDHNIILAKKSQINLKDEGSIAAYGRGSSAKIYAKGQIVFEKEKAIGLYAIDGAKIIEDSGTDYKLDFSNAAAKKNTGIYLQGADWENNKAIAFDSDHSKENIYLFAQGNKNNGSSTAKGSNIVFKNSFKVSPSAAATTQKTIAMYVDTAVKRADTNATDGYVQNTIDMSNSSAKLEVEKGSIGIYSKNATTTVDNLIKKINVSSDGNTTVGVFAEGNIKLDQAAGNIQALNQGIGLYGNKAKVTLTTGTTNVETTNKGTGIYLTNGSYLTGAKLSLKNNTTGTAAAGVYYTKGTNNNELTHNTQLEVANGSNNLLAMYLDGGVKVKNAATITNAFGVNNIGAFITGGSSLTNDANITIGSSAMTNGIGVYVQEGTATNNAGKTISVTDSNNTANSISVAMAAVGATAAKSATVTNAGTITANGDAIGMNIGGYSTGTNSGTITAIDNGTLKGIGAYVNGANAKFTNTSTGTVSSQNIALALKDTVANKITNAGRIRLTKDNAIGVYAENSVIDFAIAPQTTNKKTVALYGKGTTTINSKITSATGNGHVGVYVADSKVTFGNKSSVVVGNGADNDYGIGIYTKDGYNGTINTTITQNGDKTIGIYTGKDGTTGSTVTHQGSISVGSGIGVYVPEHSKFVASNTTFNVNGGKAVFLKGGTVDLGSTGKATINFGANGGEAIYQDGGTITTGAGLTINGTGSFLSLKNANSTINSLVKVGAGRIGINGTYDSGSYALTLGSPNGRLELTANKATGIAAVAANTATKVDIVNSGNILTTAGEKTTGIYGAGANIENKAGAKINIGAKGVGIYTTNENSIINTSLTNAGEINLIADEATGIVGVKTNTTKDFVIGKVTGSRNKLVGAFFQESTGIVNVKNANISLGTNAKGLVFDKSNFVVTSTSGKNEIKVGRTTDNASRAIAIAAINSSGTVSNTNITIGSTSASGSATELKQSIGLYTQGGNLSFDSTSGDLKAVGGNAILAYADSGTININGGKTLTVGANSIGVATKAGSVTADKTTQIEVNGANGIGAYINGGSISSNYDIKVKAAEGRGVFATGNVTNLPKVSEIKGNNSIGYILKDTTNAITIPNTIQLNDTASTGQVGVVSQGTGAGLTVNGISVVGDKNTGVYNTANQTVTNSGTLNIGASTGTSSIGIYSKGGTVVNNGVATIGNNSLGIYGENANITSGAMTVKDKAVGILAKNTTTKGVTLTGTLSVGANGAVGIQTTNANVNVAQLNVSTGDSKGIYSEGTGNVTASGNVTVGDNSVGIYKNGSGTVTTSGSTMTVNNNAYGVFSKGSKVVNNANITVKNDGIGAYVDGNSLTSTGNITAGDKAVGLLVKGTGNTLTSTGTINVGSNNSVGLYADGANISQTGTITTKANDGIGVYSKGAGSVTTSGNISVGANSIGVYKSGSGTMNIGSSGNSLSVGDKGYGIYHIGNSSSNSTINSNMTMTLGKEGVGIYGKNTTIKQTGNITVGETTIGTNGYNDPKVNQNSIGIFGDNSNITYKGTMTVDKPLSVGIYATNGGSVTLQNGAVMNIKNGATGIMTASKVSTITVGSGAVINVEGKATSPDATPANVSFGIAAYSGDIYNNGTINIKNGATGIYTDGTARLVNRGTITIAPGHTGTDVKEPVTKSKADVGGVLVKSNGEVTIGERVVTGGTINIQGGNLNMQGMGIDISSGSPIIDARSISGVATVLPNFSQGNSQQKITIKDVFRTEGIGAFTGDIKSQSVSWIAKITKDPNDTTTTTKDITMARIPYQSLIVGERYKNLAGGMEEVRQNIATNTSSPIFKSFDQITTHREFGRSTANIRGDVYSNIQERMKTVESAFDKSYDELLDSYNVTRNANKFSVIHTRGEHKDGTLGVTGYKYNSTGALYVNDREGFTYGGKYGWSAGVVGTNFKFNGDTNVGSKEMVVSGKLGLHYQTPLNMNDDNARLKWLTRGEITVNRHRMKRHSQINTDTYENKASFYSTELSWKNKIFYDYDVNTSWTVRPYVALDMSYGHIFGIKETGNELNLEVKGKDYYEVTPNVGVETKYVLATGLTHQMFVKADAELAYDVSKLYHKTNMAKIKDASTGYYKLSEPERRRTRGTVGAEIGFEKENTYGVTFRAEYQGYKKSDMNYGVRLNYKF